MNVTAALDNTVTFACSVSAVQTNSYSLIDISWVFHPTPDEYENITMESFTTSQGLMNEVQYVGISILKIDDVDRTNEGTYYCIAMYSNGINITSDKANLLIKNEDIGIMLNNIITII